MREAFSMAEMSCLEFHVALDDKFIKLTSAIERRLHLLDRLPRVRISAWLKKLREEVSINTTWKRNRNAYARLLLEQLRAGCLEVPFNSLPPDGGLPTLPAYLTYRFMSPPKQRSASYFNADSDSCYQSGGLVGSADLAGVGLVRPRSAGQPTLDNSPTFKPIPSRGAHTSWRVLRASAPDPALAGMSALSPSRSGSPPRRGLLERQQQYHHQQQQYQQQPLWSGSTPASAMSSNMSRSWAPGSSSSGLQRGGPAGLDAGRPRSPGAAGLLGAAAAIAAEIEAERGEAQVLNSRLRFAEDKIMQQEAELVRLQGQATSARRRVKTATAATLQELLDRYTSAAAAWGPAGVGQQPSGTGAAVADSVYGPVWQLISGVQSVLDSCDQEEREWIRCQGAAATALAERCYAAQADAQFQPAAAWADDTGTAAGAGSHGSAAAQQQQQLRARKALSGQLADKAARVASDAAAAAAAEAAVLQRSEDCLYQLQKQAEQVAAALAGKKEEATAAAGGQGLLGAAAVAAAAAKLLKPMLKQLKHETKDAGKLRKRLQAAAEATQAAAAAAAGLVAEAVDALLQRTSSAGSSHTESDSDSSSSTSSSSSSSGSGSDRRRRRHISKQQQQALQLAEQQQRQQEARLARLQSASQLLAELDKASEKLARHLSEGQERLLGISNSSSADAGVAGFYHDNGLAAAATAGVTASLAAAVSSFEVSVRNLRQLLQVLLSGTAAAGAAATGAAVAAAGPGAIRSSVTGQQPNLTRVLSRSSTVAEPRKSGVSTIGATIGQGSPNSPKVMRSFSSRLGDAALAGTWGVDAAAEENASISPFSPRAAAGTGEPALAATLANGVAVAAPQRLLSGNISQVASPRSPQANSFNAAAHYLIGAAAASNNSTSGGGVGGGSSGGRLSMAASATAVADAAGAASSAGAGLANPHTRLLDRAGLAGQLLHSTSINATSGAGSGLLGHSNASSADTTPRTAAAGAAAGSTPADAAADAVHARLASLSRQASRISQRATQLLSSGAGSAANAGSNILSPRTAAGAAAAPPGASSAGTAAASSKLSPRLSLLIGSSSGAASLSPRGAAAAAAAADALVGGSQPSSPRSLGLGGQPRVSAASSLLGPGTPGSTVNRDSTPGVSLLSPRVKAALLLSQSGSASASGAGAAATTANRVSLSSAPGSALLIGRPFPSSSLLSKSPLLSGGGAGSSSGTPFALGANLASSSLLRSAGLLGQTSPLLSGGGLPAGLRVNTHSGGSSSIASLSSRLGSFSSR